MKGSVAPLALLAMIASVQAADYRPVQCDTAKPYVGASLYPGISLTWDVAGSLDSTFDESTSRRLTAAVDKAMLGTGAQSMTVAVGVPGRGLWTTDQAVEGVTLTAEMHYWASAGKTLTALTILKLVEESKLSLSDPVSKYIDGVPNGNAITVEALLNHTSGLFSANEDLKVRRSEELLTFSESLAILRRHGAMFCPGENWRYTNSGYELLGKIIEILGERSFDEVISEAIVNPLALENIRILSYGDASSDVATLYSSDPEVDAMRPGSAGAAGPLAASSEAIVRLWHAVLNGEVVSPATLERMFRDLYPMFGSSPYYGLGVMVYVVPQSDGTTKLWLGHSGGAPGVKAVFAYSPSDHAIVAVALSGDGSAEATANLVINALAD